MQTYIFFEFVLGPFTLILPWAPKTLGPALGEGFWELEILGKIVWELEILGKMV